MSNGNQDVTLRALLGDVRLPGGDVLKTAGAILLALVVLLVTTDNPVFRMGTECSAVLGIQRITLLLIGLSFLLGIGSIAAVYMVMNTPVNKVRKYWKIYAPKLLLDGALLAFFSAVSLWVVALGGITRSPFSSLMCLSPAILLIGCFRDRGDHYDRVYHLVRGCLSTKVAPTYAQHKHVVQMARAVGFLPFLPIVLSLSLGQIAVAKISFHQYFLTGNLEMILRTGWYFKVYYAIYSVSALAAIYSGIPGNLTRKLLGP